MPIRSVIEFRLRPGTAERFQAAYREGRFLERAVGRPGFLGGEFLRVVGGDRFLAIAEWSDIEGYRAWQAAYDDLPAEQLAILRDCVPEPPVSTVTEILTRVGADDA